MPKRYFINRTGARRLSIGLGVYRTELLEGPRDGLKECLGQLGIKKDIATELKTLRAALDRFYLLEARSLAKFGRPKLFRIWRVDAQDSASGL